jgi:Protein of unknown function (DUF3300)
VAGFLSRVKIQKTFAVASIILAFGAGSRSLAQTAWDNAPDQAMAQSTYATSENDLANLVAPIALYPDGLLGQVLVACTYPDEVVEAEWFLENNGNLSGPQLMEAARHQNWDPSVQVLVAFPDVVALLNRDIRWTTELGNAFLAQQADVMNAVQDLRAQAQGNGQLASTAQLSVNSEVQGNQSAIEIQPADPQRMFVPNYDPAAVWGPPAQGAYPELPYSEGSNFGSLVGTVANLAGLLPGFAGWLGPQSWGWGLSWLTQALFVNNGFFSDFGFHGYGNGSRGTSLWAHDGDRRFGGRYGNNSVATWQGRGGMGGGGWRTFGNSRMGFGDRDRQSLARFGSNGGQSYRGGNWRQFGGEGRTEGAKHFGRPFSQTSRTANRGLQQNSRGGRDSYFASSAENRGGSFRRSRSLDSASRNNGFANFGNMRREEVSRTRGTSRSWGREPRFSAARMSSARGSSFERGSSSRQASSWKHGSSSHSFRQKAPKFKAPHYAKSHGGGHSSGGHSGKKSHRG